MSRASELMDSRKFVDRLVGVVELCVEAGDADIRIRIESNEEAIAEALQAVLDMAMPTFGELRSAPAVAAVIERQGGIKVGFDQAAADMQLKQELEAGIYKDRPRGIKALIPVPTEIPDHDLNVNDLRARYGDSDKKPKRKRRTKAEMMAAKGTRQEEITKRLKPFNIDKATEAQVAAEIDRLAASQITPEKAIADVIESAIKPHFATRAPGPDGFKHFVVFMSRPDGSNLSSNGTKWKDALNAAGCRATKVEMTLLNAGSRQFDLMVM